jgi:hypothetical protein
VQALHQGAPMTNQHVCNEGWICEAHPELGWPHGDCPGPGMPCELSAAQAERDGGYPAPTAVCGGTDRPQWDEVFSRVHRD